MTMDGDVEEVPGFRPPPATTEDTLDPEGTQITSPPSPTAGERPRISGEETSPSGGDRPAPPTTPSSTTFSEDIDDALAGYGEGAFRVGTITLNRIAQQRTGEKTTRWLATDEEAEAFGDALGRIARRKVPDELLEKDDAADLLIMGEVLFNYVLRVIMGIGPGEAAAAVQAWMEAQAAESPAPSSPQAQGPPPPTAPPPRPAPPPVYEDAGVGGAGVARAEPPPATTVITPAI